MGKVALHLMVLALAAATVVAQEGVIDVGVPYGIQVVRNLPGPDPTPTSPKVPEIGPDSDQVRVVRHPIGIVMWNPIDGVHIRLDVTIDNPTGRLRRIAVHWGDSEVSRFDIYYGKSVYHLPDRVTERHQHRYAGCRSEIPIEVQVYAVRFLIAWVDNDGEEHVFATEYPGEVVTKVAELKEAGYPYHITPSEWIRALRRKAILQVSACN
jgi:hypothetical protein